LTTFSLHSTYAHEKGVIKVTCLILLNDQIDKTADKNAKGHGKENMDDGDDESNNDNSCKILQRKDTN
jgi:hypothetical protein